jgi:hypothetical protein
MTKQEFISIMSQLVNIKKEEDRIRDVIRETKYHNKLNFTDYYLEDLLVKTISIAMDDKDDWIAYWIYDCSQGTDKKVNSVKVNGKKIPFKTLSNLYDLITK